MFTLKVGDSVFYTISDKPILYEGKISYVGAKYLRIERYNHERYNICKETLLAKSTWPIQLYLSKEDYFKEIERYNIELTITRELRYTYSLKEVSLKDLKTIAKILKIDISKNDKPETCKIEIVYPGCSFDQRVKEIIVMTKESLKQAEEEMPNTIQAIVETEKAKRSRAIRDLLLSEPHWAYYLARYGDKESTIETFSRVKGTSYEKRYLKALGMPLA